MFNVKSVSKLKNTAKSILSGVLTLALTFPTPVFATQVRIDRDINLRVNAINRQNEIGLKPLTTLPKGSVLEIPDEYVIKINGKLNANATINNWINQNKMHMTKYDSNGRPQYDYFFRVKVVETPDKNFNGQYGFVALKTIAEKNGLQMVTTRPAPVYSNTSFSQSNSKASTAKNTPSRYSGQYSSTEATVCLGNCNDANSPLIQRVKSELGSMLNQTKDNTNRFMSGKRPSQNFNAIAKNFEKSCFGVKFDDFANFVKSKAPTENIPPETMLSIMTQESAGSCQAIGDMTSSSKSVGLFQVSTTTIRDIDPCTTRQMQALKGKSIEQMATLPSLRCLQNPAVNFEAGMKVLKNKYKLVNNGAQPTSNAPWKQLSDKERDSFRKALSAYNGGEKWVWQSQKDIEYASKKFGIKLDDSWETIRLFFFRHQLIANGLVDRNGSTRATKNNLINVPYVEAIMGRDSDGNSQKGYTQAWAQALYDLPSNLVATSKE